MMREKAWLDFQPFACRVYIFVAGPLGRHPDDNGNEERIAVSRPPARLRKSHKLEHRPPFDCIALLLQGGGALGACQAGV